MHGAVSFYLATLSIVLPVHFMGVMKFPLLFSIWCYLCYLSRITHMLQMWSLSCCTLGLGTLGLLILVWVNFMSHFWMLTCSGKLPCLGLSILSLTLWIFCAVSTGIYISRAPWLFGLIVQCPQYVHLRYMGVDVLVIKFSKGFKFIITMVVSYGETPVLVIGL